MSAARRPSPGRFVFGGSAREGVLIQTEVIPLVAHEIYHVVVNLSLARETETAAEDTVAEDRIRQFVQSRLEGPGVTAPRISVFRAYENS